MELEKFKKTATILMWFGLLPQWLLLSSPYINGMGMGFAVFLLLIPILILMVIFSCLYFFYISYKEKSFRNTWCQLIVMVGWLTYQFLLYSRVIE